MCALNCSCVSTPARPQRNVLLESALFTSATLDEYQLSLFEENEVYFLFS